VTFRKIINLFYSAYECREVEFSTRVSILDSSARIYRSSFRETKPKSLVFNDLKRAFCACFRENWVYKFGHRGKNSKITPLVFSILHGEISMYVSLWFITLKIHEMQFFTCSSIQLCMFRYFSILMYHCGDCQT
jgi:hypothetical protein